MSVSLRLCPYADGLARLSRDRGEFPEFFLNGLGFGDLVDKKVAVNGSDIHIYR